jgi:hypothetical protein
MCIHAFCVLLNWSACLLPTLQPTRRCPSHTYTHTHTQSLGPIQNVTFAVCFGFNRNPDIATTLVGMCTRDVVAANVAAVLDALDGDASASADQDVLAEVQRILAPVQGLSWPSGLPGNQQL